MTIDQTTNNRTIKLLEATHAEMLRAQQRIERYMMEYQNALIESFRTPVQISLDIPNRMEQIRRASEDFVLTIVKAVAAAPWTSGSEEVSAGKQILSGLPPNPVVNATGDLVRSMLEHASAQYRTIWDVWFPAQKQIMDFMTAAIVKASSPNEAINLLIHVMNSFPPWEYYAKIESLAQYMWKQSGYPVNANPLDYWVSAEKHLLAVTTTAIRNAGSVLEAGTALIQALATFSAEKRFENIQRAAFFLYKARGGEHGWDLIDWLDAEEKLCT